MKTDEKGFLIQAESPRISRQFFAVKGTELEALRKSKNRSLQALAKRIDETCADNDEWWRERFRRSAALTELSRRKQAEIDADPLKKAEQDQRRADFDRLINKELK